MSINRVNCSGNIGKDPELRQTHGGTQVLTFSLAVSDRKRNPQTGEWEDATNWVPCVVFGNRAESLSRILTRGMKCAVEGKLRQSSYQGKDGKNHSKIEIVVSDVEFMSQSKAQNQPQQQQANNYTNQYQSGANSAPQQPTGYYPQPHAPNADEYAAEYADETIPF